MKHLRNYYKLIRLFLFEFLINEFNDVLKDGITHIDEAIANKPISIIGFDAEDYLKNKISYPLNEEKKKGLKLFLELMKNVGN